MIISRKTIFIVLVVILVIAAMGFWFSSQHARPSRAYTGSGSLSAYNPDYWCISNVSKGDLIQLSIQVSMTGYIWQSRLYCSNLTEIQTINDDDTHIHEFYADTTDDYLLRLFDEHSFNYTIECTHPVSEQPIMVIFSIDRSVIKEGENATLTVIVENFDLGNHTVEYRFDVNQKVSIHWGAKELLPHERTGAERVQYVFKYTLDATVPHTYIYTYTETRVFVVNATLEEEVPCAFYSISLAVYFDGEELEKTWNDLILKVEE